jgi:hypothetical protein
MVDQMMVMDQIRQDHLISNISNKCSFEIKTDEFFVLRKMFIGGLSWQTSPGNFNDKILF